MPSQTGPLQNSNVSLLKGFTPEVQPANLNQAFTAKLSIKVAEVLQRSRRPLTPTTDNGGGVGVRTPATPGSEGSRRRLSSPYAESPAVTTPEQLQQYLVNFGDPFLALLQ